MSNSELLKELSNSKLMMKELKNILE